MKGDFSRDTFHQLNHYARVLHQQGRVQLDSDVNEQTSILLHLLRTFGADVIGPHGGPANGFNIEKKYQNLLIAAGNYYIDGLLIENEDPTALSKIENLPSQPYYRMPEAEFKPLGDAATPCIIYLDAWEHHLTHLENSHIREVALGGPDTAIRSQVVWQVRIEEDSALIRFPVSGNRETKDTYWKTWIATHEGPKPKMRAQIKDDKPADPDPCSISPEARYRGLENQLYRVEVHHGGDASKATFKWSRENGSVLTKWLGSIGNKITVGNARDLKKGDWVELLDDWHELERIPGTLVKVEEIEGDVLTIDLTGLRPTVDVVDFKLFTRNPKVRRWDYVLPAKPNPAFTLGDDRAIQVKALPSPTNAWVPLEFGLEIQFDLNEEKAQYRTGDYWLIPARVLLPSPHQIEWPRDATGNAMFLEPHGVQHHYAPLAYWSGTTLTSQRREMKPIAQ
jgi:hypothetical protein